MEVRFSLVIQYLYKDEGEPIHEIVRSHRSLFRAASQVARN